MEHTADYNTIIIGGGFFGCSLALYLKQVFGRHVVILERESEWLQRASYANQARVHNGYRCPERGKSEMRKADSLVSASFVLVPASDSPRCPRYRSAAIPLLVVIAAASFGLNRQAGFIRKNEMVESSK